MQMTAVSFSEHQRAGKEGLCFIVDLISNQDQFLTCQQ